MDEVEVIAEPKKEDIVDAIQNNRGSEAMEEFMATRVYDKEKYDVYAKIIEDFGNLYYEKSMQTWCNTRWRGVPVLKTSTDLWIYQELIEQIRPDLVIETGTCYGGSALYLRDVMNAILPAGHIISIDVTHEYISTKAQNVSGLEFILGSSVDPQVIAQVKKYISDAYAQRIIIFLDSDHSKEHVLKELELYAPLVNVGGILVVEDTNVEGPFHALEEWRPAHAAEFGSLYICEKFMLTFNRGGYFERIA